MEAPTRNLPRLSESVRPVLTYLFALTIIVMSVAVVFNPPGLAESDLVFRALQGMFIINLLTLSFWFGDRFLQRTGLVEALKTKWGTSANGRG